MNIQTFAFVSDMNFQCLASWPGENGETYLSLLNTKLPQLGEEPRPRYRCAVSIKSKYVIFMIRKNLIGNEEKVHTVIRNMRFLFTQSQAIKYDLSDNKI